MDDDISVMYVNSLSVSMKWARSCSVTGEGMNEGWVGNDGEVYFKYGHDALQWCIDRGYRDVDDAYADDVIYWTEWEDENDFDEQL
jgi:hypothetical protein